MQVVTAVDREKFAVAMSSAKSEFDRRFSSAVIDKIQQFK
jgi:hypothetical protein